MQPPAQCLLLLSLLHTITTTCRVTSPRRLAAHLLREYCAAPKIEKRRARDPDCPFTLMFRKLPAAFDSPTCLSHSSSESESRWRQSFTFLLPLLLLLRALQLRHYRWHVEKRHSLSLVSHSPAAPARTRPLLVIAYSCHIYQTTNCISLLLLLSHFSKAVRASFRHRQMEHSAMRLCFHPALTPTTVFSVFVVVLFCVLPKC